jgi:hypothetical protein
VTLCLKAPTECGGRSSYSSTEVGLTLHQRIEGLCEKEKDEIAGGGG